MPDARLERARRELQAGYVYQPPTGANRRMVDKYGVEFHFAKERPIVQPLHEHRWVTVPSRAGSNRAEACDCGLRRFVHADGFEHRFRVLREDGSVRLPSDDA